MTIGGRDSLQREAEWGYPGGTEYRWPASVAIGLAVVLQVTLPDRVITGLGPRWLVPALEAALAGALLITSPRRTRGEAKSLRACTILLIALINGANFVSLGELIHDLLVHSSSGGMVLVEASVPIWITNVLVFGLWFWELDRGGPSARLEENHRQPDFLFPQMTAPNSAPGRWAPHFLDYLYVSYTNATAFSPTDTMPLTGWAKMLMMLQSFASLLTVAIVISRAVNILH